MIRTLALEADLATTEIVGAIPQTAVAIPPSSADVVPHRIRVAVAGFVIARPFDPELEQP